MANQVSELLVHGKYRIEQRLGQGSFGALYAGHNIKSNEPVAIKLEELDCAQPQLQYEAKIYKNLQGEIGFP